LADTTAVLRPAGVAREGDTKRGNQPPVAAVVRCNQLPALSERPSTAELGRDMALRYRGWDGLLLAARTRMH